MLEVKQIRKQWADVKSDDLHAISNPKFFKAIVNIG